MSPGLGNSPVRGVFFDLAGTLISVSGGIGTQYAAIAREWGIEVDRAAIDRAFPGAFASAGRMVFARPDAAEAASLEKGFWKEVVRLVFADAGALGGFRPGEFDRFFDRLFDYFETAAPWTIYPDVAPVLGALHRQGLAVGLVTNFDYRVFKLIDALGLSPLVDSITIPALAGAAKPESAIFEYALARHALRPDEAVQVGDSMRDDVEGARAAGMRGVLIDRRCRHPETDDRITSLTELPPLLGLHP